MIPKTPLQVIFGNRIKSYYNAFESAGIWYMVINKIIEIPYSSG